MVYNCREFCGVDYFTFRRLLRAMRVSDVDFGRIDAESEDMLGEYFVDTGSFARLRSGHKSYVIGRKGSGKTAIFQTATLERIGHSVVKLDFHEYPWMAHQAIREEGVSEEAAFVASWRFLFLVSFCRYWAENADSNLARQAREHLTNIFGNDSPVWHQALFDKFKQIRRIDLPSVPGLGGGGGLEFDESNKGPLLARNASQWNAILFDFASKNWPTCPVTLMTDRLDDGWDATLESKQLLIGVLKATRDINLRLPSASMASPVITLLRSDIYNHLQFNDKNKLNDDIEYLEWDRESLVDVINARIARSLDCSIEEAWDTVFSSEEMRQRASIQSYMTKRTMLRPRDMIAFCKKCQESAEKATNKIVQTSDVYDAEIAYSNHMYDELDDEMHKQVSDARGLMQTIRDIGSTRFTFSQWQEALQARQPDVTEEMAKGKLKILFDYSVVGVPRSGGSGGGTKFLYVYNDRLLEPDFGAEMSVHPSLKKPLKITEPRAS